MRMSLVRLRTLRRLLIRSLRRSLRIGVNFAEVHAEGGPIVAIRVTESTAELLKRLRPRVTESPASRTAAWEAQVKLFAYTQYAFYVGFQMLVLVFGVAIAVALVIFIARLIDGVDVTEVVGILGSVAAGVAAGVLQKLASDAKTRYNEALAELKSGAGA